MKTKVVLTSLAPELLVLPIATYAIARNIVAAMVVLYFLVHFFTVSDPDEEDMRSLAREGDVFFSPCSGTVKSVTSNSGITTISVFLSVFDEHAQFVPIDCTYTQKMERVSGAFEPAYQEHSVNNARVIHRLRSTRHTFDFTVTQITGMLARRIVTFLRDDPGHSHAPGTMLGFIKLGSRVDIALPTINVVENYVQVGEHVSVLTPLCRVR